MASNPYRWTHGKQQVKFKYTYSDIARLSGLSVNTLYVYKHNKKLNPYSLESVIEFINSRKIKKL